MSAFKSYTIGELEHEIRERGAHIQERAEHDPLYVNSSAQHDDLILLHHARMEYRKRQEQQLPDLSRKSLPLDDLG